jgi:hypothetical protein
MRRNLAISAAVGLAAAALATGAQAQSRGSDMTSSALPSPPGQSGGVLTTPSERQANLQQSYDLAIMMLKKKMERVTREDGGQLSEAHQAGLQKELDDVNHRFRNAAL